VGLEVVQNIEEARKGRVEEGGEGKPDEGGPEEDGEEFGHWLSVFKVRKGDETVFEGVDCLKYIAVMILGQISGYREFDAGLVESVDLNA
jgi:hypothetical protein